MIHLINYDCLEFMKQIPDQSVDMILQDPPYNTTACKWEWDIMTKIDEFWAEWKRIIKPNGAIVMTASQPFTTRLIASNYKDFKYCWVWEKSLKVGFQNSNRRPLKNHEDIIVFNSKRYDPQGLVEYGKINKRGSVGKFSSNVNTQKYAQKYTNYPSSVLKIASEIGSHPTQKPVALMEYLIKTYTNENETVFDGFMGSGTTGVACKNLGRKFIGCELDETYFKIADNRINGN